MKLPVALLRQFVETPLTASELGDLLTMAGFELEDLVEVGGEPVLDVKVMANRGDGLSAFGLAREVIAKDPTSKPTDLFVRASERFASGLEVSSHNIPLEIQSESCTRYAGDVLRNVKNGESPQWVQDLLTQAGMRPISLLVDLTNMVMLELGQPLHAFDLDLLQGGIIVREARQGEEITTLNDLKHKLESHHMMICDHGRPVAVAGVMGGKETEVSSSTVNVLLESAHFQNSSVRRTRKELGLNTDASYRFERSVDPDGVVAALERFHELYAQCVGAQHSYERVDLYPIPGSPRIVGFRPEKARRILGIEGIDDESQMNYLLRLGFQPSAEGSHWNVLVPSWRPDIELEEDLIEEVGRIHGYELIPEELPQGSTPLGGVFGAHAVYDTAKKTMLRCGLDQMWSHSLQAEHLLDFNPMRRVAVKNPHSPELGYLRNSLLPGLAEAALRNGGKDFRIFEIGKVFVKGDVTIDESPELSIMMSGNVREPHWAQKHVTQADFWTLKGIIDELSKLTKDDVSYDWPRLPDYRFHPTRQAGVLVDSGRFWVGTFGQIHPDIADQMGLPRETFMAELDLMVFFQQPDLEIKAKPVSRFPAVRRDISVLLSKSVHYSKVESAIRDAAGDVLERVWLFDTYEGTGIEPGHHSLAIGMIYRKLDSTFTDEEANGVRDRVVEALKPLGATLR